MTPAGALTPAAAATPRSGASADTMSVTGQVPARTPVRDKLSINPDEDMYSDGDVGDYQQVAVCLLGIDSKHISYK